MTGILVDSNVLLDVLEDDPAWGEWSAVRLAEAAERMPLIINPVIYAEVSIGFARIEELEEILSMAWGNWGHSPYYALNQEEIDDIISSCQE